MDVSVVIPTLDEERRVGLLLNDLRSQTLAPGEVLVVDGGSSDETVRLASRHARVLHSQPPVGRQRQAGLEAAGGEYVVFLDADTRLSPDFLKTAVGEMRRRRLDLACPVYVPDSRRLDVRAIYLFFNAIFRLLAPVIPSGGGMCILARRETALSGGFRTDVTYEDIEFIRRVSRRGRFGMLRARATVSVRRFERDGVLTTFGKYMLLSVFFTFGMFRMANVVKYRFSGYHAEEEHVVLVDEEGTPLGTAPKAAVHTNNTPLHRGFSVFVFDRDNRLLLQQRAGNKTTWPLTWSNSVCGHPAWGETAEDAARRRLQHELGLLDVPLAVVLPDYRYRAERNGVVENEVCPVMVGATDAEPAPRSDEVAAVRWVPWEEFAASVRDGTADISPWCSEETLLLAALPHLPAVLETLRVDLRTAQPQA